MNEKIRKTTEEIQDCKNKIKILSERIKQEYIDYLKSIGISIGDRVVTINEETGIFDGIIYEYERASPVICKIKKNGEPHASHTLWCWSIDDMKKEEIK